jgi:FAD/FMN-containing dehydrogenase
MYALDAFRAEIGDIPNTDHPRALRAKSRDWSEVSPILRKLLEGKSADLVVSPRTKDEVVRVVAAAARLRIPVTARGAGTANYGQSVPLRGGIVLDMTGFVGIVWQRPTAVRAFAGTVIEDIDIATRPNGWELRIHPSTKRVATIGGYVSGGSAGIGSCVWGGLADLGNVAGLEVISMEETPRLCELRGTDVGIVQHAFGTNCIITEVEMPLAPAPEWVEAVTVFDNYMAAVRFGVRFADEPGLIKKLVSVQEWPTPGLWRQMKGLVPYGYSTVCCLVAAPFLASFEELVKDYDGAIASACDEGKGPYGAPLYEFAFGHALQQMRRSEPGRAAVQGTFRGDDLAETVERVHRRIAGQGPLRMELTRSRGRLTGGGGIFIEYKHEDQIRALTQMLIEEGVEVHDVHTMSVEHHRQGRYAGHEGAAFKRTMDPYDLLNPGKSGGESESEPLENVSA